jgi:hypothetical protein
MSAAIAAISKLAAVKTSSIAHRTPLFTPIPELKFSHQKIGVKQEDDKAYFDDRCENQSDRRRLPTEMRTPF